ncbi:MAG: hypothetical protein OXG44_20380 [Gammaproteobacteria bacterium]|nr:hypothetical protein [Gammaproteobacteria bacterium]
MAKAIMVGQPPEPEITTGVLSFAARPGMAVIRNSAGTKYQAPNAEAAGALQELALVLTKRQTGGAVDDNYAADESAALWYPRKGDRFNALFKANGSSTSQKVGSQVMRANDGTFVPRSGSNVLGVATLEEEHTINSSASATAAVLRKMRTL